MRRQSILILTISLLESICWLQLLSSTSKILSVFLGSSSASRMMKLLYPTSLYLDVEKLKRDNVDPHPYDVKKPIPDDLIDAELLVTWTNSAENLKDAKERMKKLRFIQSLAAGPNDVLNAGFDTSKVAVATGSGLHDYTVAEHTLGLLLNAARRFFEMRDYQHDSKWPSHLGGPQPDRPEGKFTTLRDANIVIWGFGNIAKTLTPYLTALGAKVSGVARSAGERNGTKVYSEESLPDILPKTDALVMILPGSDSTKDALNSERLKMLPKHAWVVNVGRGTSIDDDALISALENDAIGGAALDVFDTEPLPEESPYWKQKNCIVSPHAAGGRPQNAEALIMKNVKKIEAGQEVENAV